jgi:diadenosine tetraphosphate (Ap4A) HIT family hydrolase
MALTPAQIKELKTQLSQQIQNLPKDKRAEAQKRIEEMSDEAIEEMLKQQQTQTQQPIFRSIVSGEIPSKTIGQNASALAVLSTKSISPGHTIIIPKSPVTDIEKIPKLVFALAKKIAKKIQNKLKAQNCDIQSESAFGEIILHVIPIYNEPLNLNSELEKKLKVTQKKPVIKISTKPKPGKVIKKPRRIP